jgi:hypothetical protein
MKTLIAIIAVGALAWFTVNDITMPALGISLFSAMRIIGISRF